MKITRIWAMPNKETFTIKPIKELLQEEIKKGEIWCDPFSGNSKIAQITNDLNPDTLASKHLDALEFLKGLTSLNYDGVIFDPPYSISQAAECYKNFGTEKLKINVANMAYWKEIKNEMKRILKPGGKVICFGWSSMGLGKNRGFKMNRILLVPHGGSKNDTIVTVETKL